MRGFTQMRCRYETAATSTRGERKLSASRWRTQDGCLKHDAGRSADHRQSPSGWLAINPYRWWNVGVEALKACLAAEMDVSLKYLGNGP